jgi:hypothetical protein
MRTTIAAAIAGAALCGGCAGYTKSDNTVYLSDGAIAPPVGAVGGDAGQTDAGADAGMDAGTDAGCAALSLTGLGVIDGCYNSQVATASISVTPPSCATIINMTTATAQCTGIAHGASDSFTGSCGSYPNCTSASLPGTINCGLCSIVICDGGSCP